MITYSIEQLPDIHLVKVDQPLPEEVAEEILLNYSCHVDHEGFDLNEIEQAYYKHNGLDLTHDKTWYKDGKGETGSNSIIYPWIAIESSENNSIIIDHSHFVVRYPITGLAAAQVRKYAVQRPELLRILSVNYKSGLDLCIDYININEGRVEPLVHIEWDFDHTQGLRSGKLEVERLLLDLDWSEQLPTILRFNKLCRENRIGAFEQADARSMMLFGARSYRLISTL